MLEHLEIFFYQSRGDIIFPNPLAGSLVLSTSSSIVTQYLIVPDSPHSDTFVVLVISIIPIVVLVKIPNTNQMVARWISTTYTPLDFSAILGKPHDLLVGYRKMFPKY